MMPKFGNGNGNAEKTKDQLYLVFWIIVETKNVGALKIERNNIFFLWKNYKIGPIWVKE